MSTDTVIDAMARALDHALNGDYEREYDKDYYEALAKIALTAAEAAGRRTMGYMDAMAFAKRGFDDWAAKDHNKKWVRLIDGTPIENDLLVNIAMAFSRPLPQTGDIK